MSSSAKNWVFTWFIDDEAKEQPRFSEEAMRYMVYQLEICPTSGRSHYQGFFILKKKTTLGAAKLALGLPTAHLEKSRGTAAQARAYCMKIESRAPNSEPVEHGEVPRQGERTDIAEGIELVRSGGLSHAWNEAPSLMIKYHRGFTAFYHDLISQNGVRTHQTFLVLLIGEAGSGKSRAARSQFPGAYYKNSDNKWWDGYDPMRHNNVVIDDFIGSNSISYTTLLALADRYPTNVEVKGGTLPFMARTIVITSNKMPEDWLGFQNLNDEQKNAFYRRVRTMHYYRRNQQPRNILQERFDAYNVDRDAWQRLIDEFIDDDAGVIDLTQ